jgi:BASS family bile acid:Na+ symporter
VLTTLLAIAAPVTNVILQLAIGMDLTPEDFRRVGHKRALVAAGLVGPALMLPPIAVVLIILMEPPPSVAGGLLLVAACPIGGISNAYSVLAGASTALSVTLTALSCLLASVTIPLISAALEVAFDRPMGFAAPLPQLVVQLTLMLMVPIAAGMCARHWAPALAAAHRGALQWFAVATIAVVLALVVARDLASFATSLRLMIPLAGIFVAASFAVGWLTAVPLSADPRDRFTLAAEFATRNIAVAITIAVTLLGQAEFAQFAAAYALVEVPMLLAAAWLFRRRRLGAVAVSH